jgi:hypothetical protein
MGNITTGTELVSYECKKKLKPYADCPLVLKPTEQNSEKSEGGNVY